MKLTIRYESWLWLFKFRAVIWSQVSSSVLIVGGILHGGTGSFGTFGSVQISLCPVEHGDSFETSHRASWSPGVHHIMQVREYDAFEAAPIEHQ